MKTQNFENYKTVSKLFAKYRNEVTILRHCGENQELLAIANKIIARAKIKAVQIPSVRKFCQQLIVNKLEILVKALPDEGFSMGSTVRLEINSKLYAIDDRRSFYSNSCKWREKHGFVKVKISPFEFRYMSVVANLATFTHPNQKQKVKECWWFAGLGSKQNFNIVRVHGYIYEGYHHPIKSEAKKGGLRKLAIEKKLKQKAANYKKALKRKYTFSDALAVNCLAGVRAFVIRCKLDESKVYTGAYLLKIAEKKSPLSIGRIKLMVQYFADSFDKTIV